MLASEAWPLSLVTTLRPVQRVRPGPQHPQKRDQFKEVDRDSQRNENRGERQVLDHSCDSRIWFRGRCRPAAAAKGIAAIKGK
jgi:hypothetical protein